MFGEFIRSFRKAGVASSTHRILLKNYGCNAELGRLNELSQSMGEIFTDHELAVFYISLKVSSMNKSSVDNLNLLRKYVRVAKQAYLVGAASNDLALSSLLEEIRLSGIDPDSISPSSS